MAQIANASSAYVAVGGGGTPLKIYDKKNDPYKQSFNGTRTANDNYHSHSIYYFDNGDGTMRLIGFYPFGGNQGDPSINLPDGYVFNGQQTINTYGMDYFSYDGTRFFGEISDKFPTTVNDGQSSFMPNAWFGGSCVYDTIINVRKQ